MPRNSPEEKYYKEATKLNNSTTPPSIDPPSFNPTPSERVKHIATLIGQLNLLEIGELLNVLQSQFKITDDVKALAFGGRGRSSSRKKDEEEEEEEEKESKDKQEKKEKKGSAPAPPPVQTEFKLKLTAIGENSKYKILKEILALKPGIQITESKPLVEKLPSVLKEGMTKEEAEQWKAKLQAAGGVVEIE